MERIKQALERARDQRTDPFAAQKRDVPYTRKRDHTPAAAPTEIVYTQTRQLEIDPGFLRANRVISSLNDPVSEPYKILRTKVLQRMRANNWRTLALTSPTEGCGKTLTAINLAISIAREANQTVLLVDLDMKRPQVQRYLTRDEMPGISDYLLKETPVPELLFNLKGIERLVVLPGHDSITHSSEMLSSPRMVNLMQEMKSRYPSRLILIDMPPVLACDDVLAFSPHLDAVLLVASDGETDRDDLTRAVGLLEKMNVLGITLNKSSARNYGYYY
ncbi:CpsD/CapB family tyrosine-protein kinase [Thioalkalivibrio sp.]|uniref:CpsD/CapB family tyrosine-protein kinase n=1 Tax=Thioalkalivibrio sp. TaxID=2093813 RepID=UPI0035664654